MKASFLKVIFDSERPFHCEYFDLQSFDHPWHFHPEVELTMILESSGNRYVGDQTNRFKEGDLVLLGAGLPHLWQNDKTHVANSSDNSRAIVLQFHEKFAGGFFSGTPESKQIQELFQLAERGISFSRKIAKQATEILWRILESNGLKKWIAILDLLSLLIESKDYTLLASVGYSTKFSTRDCLVMDRVFEYVRNNIDKKITLQQMADITHLSKPSFCRFFKNKTSKAFFTFLNEYRVSHARKMLQENSQLSVTTIAFQSGFPSIQYFNSKFKDLTGLTPSQFRKERNVSGC